MQSIKMTHPKPNTMCIVRVVPYLSKRTKPYRFVTYSDGGYFWDNLDDEILQNTEVTHWKAVK